MNNQLGLTPGRMILVSFTLVILIGAFLLKLPLASVRENLSWIDALFMSTSATCVTGLSVMDIGTELTLFGQTVVLVLIQLGGLGIMTFSVFLMMLFRQNVTLSTRMAVNFEPQYNQFKDLLRILLFVIGMTLSIEALGASLLFLRFKEFHSIPHALYSAVFHAVSAFCNAGFSLYEDSLIRFQKETFVPFVIMGLIILGGLGFMLIDEIRVWLHRRIQGLAMKLSLHTRVCLTMTFILIIVGAVFVFLLERHNLLWGFTGKAQIINSLFMSVTSRTAGFNMLEIPSLTNATLFFVIWLMFVGACPGSTAGGIKVTSIAVLFSLMFNQLKNRSASLFKRKISDTVIIRSLSIFAISFFLIMFSTFLFLISEQMGVSHLESKVSFLDLLFEVSSAFGTVGLSTGVTSTLTEFGKFFVIVIMFIGRVGPLTLGVIFLTVKKAAVFEYIEEDIAIG